MVKFFSKQLLSSGRTSLVLFCLIFGCPFFSYIGSLTGIKPGVFSISINERNALKGGYIGLLEWLLNINRNQSFITLAIRDMLMKSESFDQTVKYLAEVPLLAPCYYIIAGPKAGQVREYLLFFRSITYSLPLQGCHYNSFTQWIR